MGGVMVGESELKKRENPPLTCLCRICKKPKPKEAYAIKIWARRGWSAPICVDCYVTRDQRPSKK